MAEQLKKIEEKTNPMWFEGSPVVMCSMQLSLNTDTGELFASAKFMNVQPDHIKSITFDVICYDEFHNPIDTICDVRYSGFDVSRNMEFGYNRRIPVPNMATRMVEYVVKNLTNLSGDVWFNHEEKRFNKVLEQQSIFDVQGDLNRQFLDICARTGLDGSKLIFQPVFERGHWLCACGTLNWNEEAECSMCGAGKLWLERNSNLDNLRKHAEYQENHAQSIRQYAEKPETEEEKRQRKAEYESRKARYQAQLRHQSSSKIRKILLIILLVAVVGAAGTYGTIYYLIPYLHYAAAVRDIEADNYDAAIAALESLNGFMDSKEQILKARYGKALKLYHDGSKAEAAEIFLSLGTYFDSQERYYATRYDMANDYIASGDYDTAASIFFDLGEYSDSAARFEECRDLIYENGKAYLEKGKYDQAFQNFSMLEDYKDSADLVKESIYRQADMYYNAMHYADALNEYRRIPEYKDVAKKMKKYQNLADLISASKGFSPAVWTSAPMNCPECGKDNADFVVTFGENGSYALTVTCSDKPNKPIFSKKGRFKIEGDTIYDYEYDGQAKWVKIGTIKNLTSDSTYEGKNAVLEISDVFYGSKSTLLLYGNIITRDNIEISGS